MSELTDLQAAIRDVVDFPKPGIVFKDITPVLADPVLLRQMVDHFADRYRDKDIDRIAAVDARGFIIGSALAYALGVGMVPIRKKGKLPFNAIEHSYDLEYGSATLQLHIDAVEKGERVLLVDDLLATGGTLDASIRLLNELGAEIHEVVVLVELAFLKGRERLAPVPVYSPIIY